LDFNFDFTPTVQISLKLLDLHLSYFLEKSCALCPESSESSIKFGNHGLKPLAGLGNGIGDFQFRDDDPDRTWDVCIIVEFLDRRSLISYKYSYSFGNVKRKQTNDGISTLEVGTEKM